MTMVAPCGDLDVDLARRRRRQRSCARLELVDETAPRSGRDGGGSWPSRDSITVASGSSMTYAQLRATRATSTHRYYLGESMLLVCCADSRAICDIHRLCRGGGRRQKRNKRRRGQARQAGRQGMFPPPTPLLACLPACLLAAACHRSRPAYFCALGSTSSTRMFHALGMWTGGVDEHACAWGE